MPVYEYTALNRKGRKVAGIITAEGPSRARLKLSQGALFPTGISEMTVKGEKGKTPAAFFSRVPGLARVSPVVFTTALRQLATLVSSGIPVLEGLDSLIAQTERNHLRRVFTLVREKVAQGASLCNAVSEHPRVFKPIHVNLIRAGESSGTLDIVLKRLADYSEGRRKLRSRVEAALVYPLFLLLSSTAIVCFVMSFVMPRVLGIFQVMDLTLPWTTRALIYMTGFMEQHWWLFVPAVAGTAGGLYVWVKTESGGRAWDLVRLNVPVFGKLHHTSVMAGFSRTLSILLKSGIPLKESLEIVQRSLGNRIMAMAVKETAVWVSEGQDFGAALKKSGRFSSLLVQMVSAGEQSGELGEMLGRTAAFYEEEVASLVASITSLIEPAIILGMGVMTGFLVMAVLLPVLGMSTGLP